MKKTSQMRCIELERGQPLERIIAAKVAAGDTWEEIALDLGITRLTLREWLLRLRAKVETHRTVRFPSDEAYLQ